MPNTTSIAVLGCGMVTPFGAGIGREMLDQRPRETVLNDQGFWPVPDSLVDSCDSLNTELRRERAAWITALALNQACKDADISLDAFPADRIALVVGCAFAGQLGMLQFADEVREQSARFVSPIHFPQTVGNYIAGALSRAFKIQGPNLTIAEGASSGLGAIRAACDLLNDNSADIAVAGGSDVLTEALARGWKADPRNGSDENPLAEGACFYIFRRSDQIDSDKSYPTIRDWSVAQSGTANTCSAAPVVGNSFAAESAARLIRALELKDSASERTITHVTGGASGHRITVDAVCSEPQL